jgi:hypothetical protein
MEEERGRNYRKNTKQIMKDASRVVAGIKEKPHCNPCMS